MQGLSDLPHVGGSRESCGGSSGRDGMQRDGYGWSANRSSTVPIVPPTHQSHLHKADLHHFPQGCEKLRFDRACLTTSSVRH